MLARTAGLACALLLLLGVVGLGGIAAAADADRPVFQKTTVLLDRGDGTVLTYQVELATTPHQHRVGLMHRQHLAPDAGMLFIFNGMAVRSFWMKNTLIPLDMLFFDDKGRLVSAIRDVPAGSLTARRSDGRAKYVLELNAGTMTADAIGSAAMLRLPVDM